MLLPPGLPLLRPRLCLSDRPTLRLRPRFPPVRKTILAMGWRPTRCGRSLSRLRVVQPAGLHWEEPAVTAFWLARRSRIRAPHILSTEIWDSVREARWLAFRIHLRTRMWGQGPTQRGWVLS